MKTPTVLDVVPKDLAGMVPDVSTAVMGFIGQFEPLELQVIHVLTDALIKARYIECHVRASNLVNQSTIDVPLDPEDQPDYRANRELVEDHVAFARMKADAKGRRTFSNLVGEYSETYDTEHPLKIIGGQHRFMAIKEALDAGVNEYHGVKVYFGLDPEQRLDVQVISN